MRYAVQVHTCAGEEETVCEKLVNLRMQVFELRHGILVLT
jgi:hypothetical protein